MYKYAFSKIVFLSFVVSICSSFSQSPEKIRALNYYVEFLNESVHGLSVAQILYVNYNKDLNKYVDLKSDKINTHITNHELGTNLFDNPDINTSDNNTTAMMLSKLTKEQSKFLETHTAKMLNAEVTKMVGTLTKINNLRFKIEKFIATADFDKEEDIYKCYDYLERAVALFNSYYQNHSNLSSKLRKELKYDYKPMDFMFYEIHSASVLLLNDLRNGNLTTISKYQSRISGALDNYKQRDFNLTTIQQSNSQEIVNQVEDLLSFLKKSNSSPVPENYKNNSRSYYLHNTLLLSFFNSISPGFVSKMNKLVSSTYDVFLSYDDRPVLFEVTYPEKMQEQDYVELEFYDPDLIDRDSIIVNFNDKIILENYRLEATPLKIRIDIDSDQGNSVTIFAVNEGIISPNTVGFKYRFNGKGRKKTIIKKMSAQNAYELVLTIEGLGGISDQ